MMETTLVGIQDVLFITLDTLRYDVAVNALERGLTPNLAALIPGGQWEKRHTPGTFTYAAHHAFFAGFLPTPAAPGRYPRRFAARFPGSGTTTAETLVFDTPDIVSGFAALGYHTICIGGVHFFDKQSALGNVLPSLFMESHWSPALGVTDPHSTENQIALVVERLNQLPKNRRVFLFINISAMHPPNHIYVPGATHDSIETQTAALAYVDRHLPKLFHTVQRRAPVSVIICSDHGTTYGEDGYTGHRISHPIVLTVPYAEFSLPELK